MECGCACEWVMFPQFWLVQKEILVWVQLAHKIPEDSRNSAVRLLQIFIAIFVDLVVEPLTRLFGWLWLYFFLSGPVIRQNLLESHSKWPCIIVVKIHEPFAFFNRLHFGRHEPIGAFVRGLASFSRLLPNVVADSEVAQHKSSVLVRPKDVFGLDVLVDYLKVVKSCEVVNQVWLKSPNLIPLHEERQASLEVELDSVLVDNQIEGDSRLNCRSNTQGRAKFT